jgi:glycosyltransferase involved in cell wall biosynthesis
MKSNLKITILSHSVEQATGFPDAFADYLNEKKIHTFFIRFPFFHSITKAIWVDEFSGGQFLSRKLSWIRFYRPEILSFFKDFIWAITYGIRFSAGSDFVLVTNNLLGFAAWILRSLGLIKKFTYLVIDYSPTRFKNPLIEKIYVLLDKFVAYRADSVWTMSQAMLEGRDRDGKLEMSKVHFRVSPVGNNSDKLSSQELNQFIKKDLVFVGNPNALNVRADLLLDMAFELKKRGHQFRLRFVGPGDTSALKAMALQLGISDLMVYRGPIPDALDLDRFLATCGIGLAPYDPNLVGNFSRFADPAKIKTYLGASLPVITTSVPPNARELEESGAGRIAEFSASAHADCVEEIWSSDEHYHKMRSASLKLGLSYSWTSIFDRLLQEEKILNG